MNLSTSRLNLRSLEKKDFPDIHEMNSYPQVAQYNTIGIPKDISITTALLEEVMEKDLSLAWSIRKKDTGEFVGQFGMNLSSEKYRKAEIYYSLHPNQWGRGFATEAVSAVISYGFSELRLHRIEAGVATENRKSVALLERVGMLREGLCRKILPLQSGWADNYMYAILEEDSREF
ncbi:MAG: GNAT family N-acetyltransferase [Bacteroidota bacterium]